MPIEQSILEVQRAFHDLGLALLIAILAPIGVAILTQLYKAYIGLKH